jgi:glycosyltransferase involved in cell wall biosynthesis
MHLIGLKLKEQNPSLQWIVDFRDPWSEWDLLDTLSLTSWARKQHQKLEKKVLMLADHVITIAPYHVQRLEMISKRKVELITNGFDEEDFKGIVRVKTSKFTLRHIGVVDELRDPRPIMEALKKICQSDETFNGKVKVEFVGNVNSVFKQYVQQDAVLNSITHFINQVPHDQLLALYGETDLQLLVLAYTAIAPGNLPGKFFEYLASGNPIIGIGPVAGDAADVLRQTKAGEMFERQDQEGIKNSILNYFTRWSNQEIYSSSAITQFSRKHLTEQLIRILASKP